MPATVEVRNLRKRFGPVVAVDGVSFKARGGEIVGFLGPNGAGKSTTMKMIVGFLEPTAGEAIVCGHNSAREPLAAKSRIGYLPEGAPLYGDMTPESFLRFVAETRGFRGAEKKRRVALAVERTQLEDVLRQPIETLSKGFKRRVGLAQAILHDPEVLILDEPTDGLDPNQKHEVRRLIRSMAKDKVIILSTHILEEVDAVCTRAVVIARGKVVADGTPEQLEARSRYHDAVSLRARGGAKLDGAVVAALEKLPNVEAVEREGSSYIVIPKGGASIVASVESLLRERGVVLDEMRLERGRLEEVFRRLTTGHSEPLDADDEAETSDDSSEREVERDEDDDSGEYESVDSDDDKDDDSKPAVAAAKAPERQRGASTASRDNGRPAKKGGQRSSGSKKKQKGGRRG